MANNLVMYARKFCDFLCLFFLIFKLPLVSVKQKLVIRFECCVSELETRWEGLPSLITCERTFWDRHGQLRSSFEPEVVQGTQEMD